MTDGDDVSSSDPDLSAPPTPSTDPIDVLLRRVVRAPAALPQLQPGDELVGRFRIERLVGSGGMGAVYLAFDSTLERQVAIKVRYRDGATDRIRREAIAMARLAHPNVITVFEVGNIGDQAFVAMEYIAGTTLREWMQHAHSERERIEVLLAAGAGLAAAHEAELIHRDFKPENVLIGEDGRPRVGDFGLARGSQSRDEPPASSTGNLATSLTATGAVLGTPAYMAPEQANGEIVDARADQFAFCVVAWEVLSGQRPFAGAQLSDIMSAIEAGPGPNGPKRTALRNVLARGLSRSPGERYPDVRTMLSAMRRATRRRWPWLAVPIVVAAALAIVVGTGSSGGSDCDGAGSDLELPTTVPVGLRALGTPLAIDGATRVQAEVDAFAVSYRSLSVQTCKATRVEHSWSDDLGARANVCLELARRQAEATLSLPVTSSDVANLVVRASSLPPPTLCGDASALAASPPLPHDPTQVAEIIVIQAQLAVARTDALFGRKREAKAAVATIAASRAASTLTVAPWLEYVRGEIALADDQLVDAEQHYANAYFAARGIGDVALTLATIERLILSSGNNREDKVAAEGWIRNGLADADRSRRLAPLGAAMVYAVAARVRAVQDRPDDAVTLGATAVELAGTRSSIQIADVLAMQGENLCAVGRYDDCFALDDRALAMARSLVGPKHPRIAQMLGNFALDRQDGNRPKQALAYADEAREVIAVTPARSSLETGNIENSVAAVIIDSDLGPNVERARPMLVDARRRLVAVYGEDHPDVAQIDSNLSSLDIRSHHFADAIAHAQSALVREEINPGPTSARVADTLYNLAVAKQGTNDFDGALAAARRSLDIRAQIGANTLQHANALSTVASIENAKRDYASARRDAQAALAIDGMAEPIMFRGAALVEAARAEIGLRNAARARKLLVEARALFAKLGSDDNLATCDQLLESIRAR